MMMEPLTLRVMHWDLPSRPMGYLSPSPSPSHSHPVDEWLNWSLSDLHLHPWQQESRSWMWRDGTPMHTKGGLLSPQKPVAECPPLGPVGSRSSSTGVMIWVRHLHRPWPYQLPKRECYWWVEWYSPPLRSLDCRSLTAAMWQWPPVLSYPHQRSSNKNHCQAQGHCLGLTQAEKDAQPSGSSWWLDLGADEPKRKAPSLVEGA